jgi:hypothetical protein
MKVRVSVFSIIFIMLLTSTVVTSAARVYVAEPYLVQQPSYAGMTFYVYRPNGMEKDWFLTFDGYAVTQAGGKIWVYGTMQSGALTRTNYAVGSVNPALAGIIPYFGANGTFITRDAEIVITNQPYGAAPPNRTKLQSNVSEAAFETRSDGVDRPTSSKGSNNNEAYVLNETWYQTAKQVYIPDWSVNPSFLAISNWKSTVDRIGILHKYNIPVAWKGDYPAAIYAWTGKNWKQLLTRGEGITETIKINLYGLLRTREKSRPYRWYAEDIPILTEKTIGWGYLWMGEIFVKN